MTTRHETYRCNVCGNIVNIDKEGAGELHCCSMPMQLLKENTQEAATEKHIPEVHETDTGIKVVVGEVIHPMDDDHFIEWIDVITQDGVMRKYLNPGDEPVAHFPVTNYIRVRAYCNLHGLWSNK